MCVIGTSAGGSDHAPGAGSAHSPGTASVAPGPLSGRLGAGVCSEAAVRLEACAAPAPPMSSADDARPTVERVERRGA